MEVKISFEQSELPELIEYYSSKRYLVASQLALIDGKLKTLYAYQQGSQPVSSKNNAVTTNATLPLDYPKDGTWLHRVIYLIGMMGGSATTKAIVEKIMEIDNISADGRSAMVSRISAIMSNSKENGVIVKKKNRNDEFVYSVKEKADEETSAQNS